MFKNFINIITSPSEVFSEIKEKPTFWSPFLVLLALMAVTQFIVFKNIDFDYLITSMAEQIAEQQDIAVSEAKQSISILTPTLLMVSSIAGVIIVLPIVFVISAAYLNLIAKLSDDKYKFAHWFSLTCWTSMPTAFTALASIANVLLSSSGQFTETQFNPISLGNLLSIHDSPISGVLQSIDLTTFWTWALAILGYKFLTQCSGLKASIIVLAPGVLIYGGWAALALL